MLNKLYLIVTLYKRQSIECDVKPLLSIIQNSYSSIALHAACYKITRLQKAAEEDIAYTQVKTKRDKEYTTVQIWAFMSICVCLCGCDEGSSTIHICQVIKRGMKSC